MLKDLMEKRACFKLVCGAGNEDAEEVEKLVTIYSLAGCQFFDVCAKPEIVDATKKGIQNSGIEQDRYICVSVGISGDPHITKALINKDLCITCGACKSICPHDAIVYENGFNVNESRCIGCSKCLNICPQKSISMYSKIQDYEEVLPELIAKGIDCIEFHAISTDEDDVDKNWAILNNLYNGMLCISLDRSELGDKKLKERVNRLLSSRKPYTTIIQADGVAMSGNDDEYGTTLQAVATAQLFQNAKMPVYIMMSGGTNIKSTQLTKMCGVYPNCLAVGSYARKIVKDYLQMKDLLSNPDSLNKAVEIARNLVQTSLENLKRD